ncbi:MAG TPA: hypothetical protein VFN42_07680 [Acetobacteraceae bacterium]|nr:hypothetical protein [Acetobacteraceae bacterium]
MPGSGPRRIFVRASSFLALGLLAGCDLVGQNTFAPAPPPRPAPVAAQAPASAPSFEQRRALVTIDEITPVPDYRPLLHYAVRAAEARDRGVQFDVVAVLPDLSAAEAGQREASAVMRAIMADGVPPTRIHLGLHAEPGLAHRQVRVYVR